MKQWSRTRSGPNRSASTLGLFGFLRRRRWPDRCLETVAGLRANFAQLVFGTPVQVVDRLRIHRELGVDRVHLQTVDMTNFDHLDLIAAEVTAQLT